MDSTSSFHPFCTSHLVVLVTTMCLTALMIFAARRRWAHLCVVERVLALLMLISWPGTASVAWAAGRFSWDVALPLHYCNVGTFAGIAALLMHRQLACEMAYFFGLAGMLQGLLTPALRIDFPAPAFFFFFFYHVGGVVTALYVVLGLRVLPRPGSVLRMCKWSSLYVIVACLVDWLLGTNFGFFREKPPSPSLMDVLGPWPWYVGSLVLIAIAYYSVLNLPFVIQRWRMKELSLPTKSD
jgi:hypothetical integral membrane protein (TIGR02206 family)